MGGLKTEPMAAPQNQTDILSPWDEDNGKVTEDEFDKRTTGPLEKGLEDILLGKDLIEYRKVRQGMDKYKGPYDESPPELLALKRQYLGFCFDAIDDIGPLRDSGRGDTVIDFEEMTMILEDDMDESQIKEMMKAFYHANHDMEIPNNDPTQGKMNKQQFTNGIFTTLEAHGLGDEGPQFLQGMKLLETQIYNATERYKEESIC